MDPVQKALWYVESHSRKPITLEEIASVCKISAFHLTRAFSATMGLSLMRYVRARRLSEGARQLAEGAEDILTLALDAGYGSHEAFTRAFRDQFGLTPEQLRAQGNLNNIQLVEPIVMNSTPITDLATPRFETPAPMLMAGIVERYRCESPAGIPDQWQKFLPYLGQIPKQVGKAAYGVCFNFDGEGNFDYMTGVEISFPPLTKGGQGGALGSRSIIASEMNLPTGFTSLRIPSQRYAVFAHGGYVASIRGTFQAIWSQWFPKSGEKPVNGPTLERYGEEFNPQTGMGGFEIWIPIQA